MASAQEVCVLRGRGNLTDQGVEKELDFARGYYEQGTNLGWGQFSGVSSWIIHNMNKKAGSVSGGRAARGWPGQRVFLGDKEVLEKSQGRAMKALDI